jgi:hypothetical protein
MQASRLIALEFDHESGTFVPFSLDDLKDETAGFTTPLDGMPVMWRDKWQVIRKRVLAQGEAPEMAWYRANAEVADLQVKWRDKARKRFFRS